MKINKLKMSSTDFSKAYADKTIPDKHVINGREIPSRYEIGSGKFLIVENEETGNYCAFLQTQANADAKFISKVALNKNGVFSVDGASLSTAYIVTKENKNFVKDLIDLSKEEDFATHYRLLNQNKFDRSYKNDAVHNLMTQIADLHVRLEEATAYGQLADEEMVKLNQEVENALAEGLSYLTELENVQAEAVELADKNKNLEITLDEYRAIERERNVLAKELGEVSQKYMHISNALKRNRQYIQMQDEHIKYQNETIKALSEKLKEKQSVEKKEQKPAKPEEAKKQKEVNSNGGNMNTTKTYRLTSANGNEQPIYLAVGPHYNARMRKPGEVGKGYQTLYVVKNGDPEQVKDHATGNVLPLETVLTDEKKRDQLDIHGVKHIYVDKKGNARVVYYDTKIKTQTTANGAKTISGKTTDNNIVKTKDADQETLVNWVNDNYGAGKITEVKPTFKTKKALKIAGITTGVVVLAGVGTFAGLVGWGGNPEVALAQESGKKQVASFVDELGDQTLFQYGTSLDENGKKVYYTKADGTLVEGNEIVAIGNANRIFYKEASNKVDIKPHKQQQFFGKLRDYKDETIIGASYQLGAAVVAELNENNVPVFKYDNTGNKEPLYAYLNNASKHDYTQRSDMILYLEDNGYSAKMAEAITSAYEDGFDSGLENGLSNKVEEIIGGSGIVEKVPVNFADQTTKEAIATVIANQTTHGKRYTADDLKVCYSDVEAKTNADDEQVIFVIANKEGATGAEENRFLYKLLLTEGVADEIEGDEINDAIMNAEEVTESIKMEYMFKNLNCDGIIEKYYSDLEGQNIAYVSNYGLEQAGENYKVAPSVTIYNNNTRTVVENAADTVVSVEAGKDSSITEMCALAVLGDYGYYDQKGIYTTTPVASQASYTKTYSNDNESELIK